MRNPSAVSRVVVCPAAESRFRLTFAAADARGAREGAGCWDGPRDPEGVEKSRCVTPEGLVGCGDEFSEIVWGGTGRAAAGVGGAVLLLLSATALRSSAPLSSTRSCECAAEARLFSTGSIADGDPGSISASTPALDGGSCGEIRVKRVRLAS